MLHLLLWFSHTLAAPVTIGDLSGTWTEQGECLDSDCTGSAVFSRSSVQFYESTDEWDPNSYYSSTLRHFQDESCVEGAGSEVLNITVDGVVLFGHTKDQDQHWTSLKYLPTTLTVYMDVEGVGGSYSFPDETCTDALSYLNEFCPCDGEWTAGTARTVAFSECTEGTCTAFEGLQQYGKVQIPIEDILLMTHSYTIEAQSQADPKVETVLMKTSSKYYTPKLGAGNDDKNDDNKEGEEDKREEGQFQSDDSSSSSSDGVQVNTTNSTQGAQEESTEGINALLIYAAIGIGAAVGMLITGAWYYIASKKELTTADYQSIQDPQVHQTFT